MKLSNLTKDEQDLVQYGLRSPSSFVRSVAETVERTDRMSVRQRAVLEREMDGDGCEYDDYDLMREDMDFADAMGGSPWGDD